MSPALSASALAASAAAIFDSDDDSESDSEPPALVPVPRSSTASSSAAAASPSPLAALAAGAHLPSISTLYCPTRRRFTESEQLRMDTVLAAEPNLTHNRRRHRVLFPQLAAEFSVRGNFVTAGQIKNWFKRRSAETRQQAGQARAVAQSAAAAAARPTAMPTPVPPPAAAAALPAALAASTPLVVAPVSSGSCDALSTDMSSSPAVVRKHLLRRFSQAEKLRLRTAVAQGLSSGRSPQEDTLYEQLAAEFSVREPITVKQLRDWVRYEKRTSKNKKAAAAAATAPGTVSLSTAATAPSVAASTAAAAPSVASSTASVSSVSHAALTAPAATSEIPLRNFTMSEMQLMQLAIVQGIRAEDLVAGFSMREPVSAQQVHTWMQQRSVEILRAVAATGAENTATAQFAMSAQWLAIAWLSANATAPSSSSPAQMDALESPARQHLLNAQSSANHSALSATLTLAVAPAAAAARFLVSPQTKVSAAAAASASSSFDLLSPSTAVAHPADSSSRCPHCNKNLTVQQMQHIPKCALRTPDERIAAEKRRVELRAREAEGRKKRAARKAAEAAAAAALTAASGSSAMCDDVVPPPISSPIAASPLSLPLPRTPMSPSASDAPAMLDPLSGGSRKRPSATAAAAALHPAASAEALPFPPPGCVSFGSFPMEWYNSLDDSKPLNFLFSAHNVMHPSVSAALRKSEEDKHAKAKAQAEFGCDCPNGVCWPATCPCSAAGRTAYSRHGKLLLQPGEHPEYVVECCANCSCNVTSQAASNAGLERTASTTLASPIMDASPSDLSRMQTEQSTMSDVAVADSPATSDSPAVNVPAAPAPLPAACDPTLVLSAPLPADAAVFIVGEDVFAVSTTGVPHRVLTPSEAMPSPSPPPPGSVLNTAAAMQGVAGSSDSSPPLADSPATAAGASSPSVSVPRPLPLRCFNRVVQLGAVGAGLRLVVFKTLDKGWALKTLTRIPRFSFVCEYIGELIHEHLSEFRGAQLAKRKRSNYLFTPALSSKAATEAYRRENNRNGDQPVRSPGVAKPPPTADDSYDIDRECFSIDSSQVRPA